jgi:hypothetical protein
MCLVISILLFGPRLVLFLWWLLEPAKWAATFESAFVPLIGFFLFPWTTLSYVVVAPQGVTDLDWLLIGLGVVADVASFAGSSLKGRGQMPGYQAPPPGPPMSPP